MRNKRKKEKVRVCINLDKDIVDRIDDYIDNLSRFLNTTLKNYIDLKDNEKLKIEKNNTSYVELLDKNKKRTPTDNEVLNTDNQWWE